MQRKDREEDRDGEQNHDEKAKKDEYTHVPTVPGGTLCDCEESTGIRSTRLLTPTATVAQEVRDYLMRVGIRYLYIHAPYVRKNCRCFSGLEPTCETKSGTIVTPGRYFYYSPHDRSEGIGLVGGAPPCTTLSRLRVPFVLAASHRRDDTLGTLQVCIRHTKT